MKNLDHKSVTFLTRILTIFFLLLSNVVLSQAIYMKKEISAGLSSPMQIAHAGDGTGRIFVAERGGTIKVFSSTYALLGTYLNMSSRINSSGEGGLLSIAFHPDFETNGCLFVHFTDDDDHIIVSRYQTTNYLSNTIPATGYVDVLSIDHPASNHFGGEMHFGSDNNLYISVGDGGGSNDASNNAQNINSLLGKILRITVATSGTDRYTIPVGTNGNPFRTGTDIATNRNLVYAYGLRNPFRWSFDRLTGDMWIGDVGQGGQEEINFTPAASTSGANYAWRCFEGAVRNPAYTGPAYNTECSAYSNYTPRFVYVRSGTQVSVVGGVVYRGSKYPAMAGYYIGSDYYTGQFHVLAPGATAISTTLLTTPKGGITDFGESESGDIFAVAMGENAIYRFVDSNVEPLPVTLVNFNATKSVEGNLLKWKTSSEKNFQQFDIEHSSNAQQFEKIGTVASLNAVHGSSYQFTDNRNTAALSYYRLKLLDMDGTFDYSRVITVGENDLETPFVRPTVVTNGMLNLDLASGFHSMELINTSGKSVLRSNISGKTGMTGISVNNIGGGLYVVRLTADNSNTVQQKVVIVP